MSISVILPVYNAQDYLRDAVESILAQTYRDFTFIIINDGSTDDSLEILQEYADKDKRIKLVSRENRGLIYTLNEAISLCDSKYIARMDADDVALPKRFEKQVDYLERHPKVAVLGTGYRYLTETGEIGKKRSIFTSHEDIVASFFFGNPIAHPSVMINFQLTGEFYQYISGMIVSILRESYKYQGFVFIIISYR